MQCPACSFQNRPQARFCYSCGYALTRWNQASVLPAPSAQTSTLGAGPAGSGWQPPTPAEQSTPADPAASVFPPSGTAPPRSRASGGFKARGTARMVQFRSGQSMGLNLQEVPVQVLDLLLEQYDSGGNRALLAVEMRGDSIDGVINDGDEVEVAGRWKNGLLHTTKIYNRTTGSPVKAKTSTLVRIFLTVFIIIFIVLFVMFILFIVGGFRSF